MIKLMKRKVKITKIYLALCLHMLSNYNEALKIYDQAIFINKTANKFNAKGIFRSYNKADTLLALGRRNEAK